MPPKSQPAKPDQRSLKAAEEAAPAPVSLNDDYLVEEIDPEQVDAELLALIAGRPSRQARWWAAS